MRVLPVPWLLYLYGKMFFLQSREACGLNAADYSVGLSTVLITIALNLFWFSLMVKKIQRMFSKTKKK